MKQLHEQVHKQIKNLFCCMITLNTDRSQNGILSRLWFVLCTNMHGMWPSTICRICTNPFRWSLELHSSRDHRHNTGIINQGIINGRRRGTQSCGKTCPSLQTEGERREITRSVMRVWHMHMTSIAQVSLFESSVGIALVFHHVSVFSWLSLSWTSISFCECVQGTCHWQCQCCNCSMASMTLSTRCVVQWIRRPS